MIQRSVCLCDGKYIGIESIYTVIDGKQINIPEKLEALRQKGRNKPTTLPRGAMAARLSQKTVKCYVLIAAVARATYKSQDTNYDAMKI